MAMGACRCLAAVVADQHFALADMVRLADHPVILELFDEGGGPVVADPQMALDEAGRGDQVMVDARMALLEDLEVLEITERVGNLTKDLVSTQLIPSKAASDAVHIAVACVHEMDFLVTWNCKHIANPFIRE